MKEPNKRKIILTKYTRHVWGVAKVVVYEDGKDPKTYRVNAFYEVTNDAVLIYDTIGGSGTGYRKGDLLHRIQIDNSDFETIEQDYE